MKETKRPGMDVEPRFFTLEQTATYSNRTSARRLGLSFLAPSAPQSTALCALMSARSPPASVDFVDLGTALALQLGKPPSKQEVRGESAVSCNYRRLSVQAPSGPRRTRHEDRRRRLPDGRRGRPRRPS